MFLSALSRWTVALRLAENVSFIQTNNPSADFVSPEPATAVLLGAGLAAFAARCRTGRS